MSVPPGIAASPSALAAEAMQGRPGTMIVVSRRDGRVLALLGRAEAGRAHPIGSLAKVWAVLAASRSLEGESWSCRGLHGSPPCWTSHGKVDVTGMIAGSCSSAAARMGDSLGVGRLRRGWEDWQLTTPTACLASPREEAGRLPAGLHAAELASGRAWGMAVTPLRVAAGVLALADGQPRAALPHESRLPGGTWTVPDSPNRALVLRGMALSTRSGTARGSAEVGFLGAKTGTAPDGRGGRDGWFAGWTRDEVVVVWLRGRTGYEGARDVAISWGRRRYGSLSRGRGKPA